MVHEHLIRFFNGFNHDAHPMAIMVSVVGARSAFYDDKHMTYENAEQRYITGVRVFAKMATIAAMAYKVRSIQTFFTHRPVSTLDRVPFRQLTGELFFVWNDPKTAHGQPIVYPRDDLNYAQNFMYMMFALPTRRYALDPTAARCLEVILMLHADHEQNASTSTVRIAGSSQVRFPYTGPHTTASAW